jgi:hypothetical protein
MNRTDIRQIIIALALAGIAATTVRASSGSVALVTKTIKVVTKKTAANDWNAAAKGDVLTSGDQVRTAEKSLAVVKFIDNSLVRVREKSELTVNGESGTPGRLSKVVRLGSGAFGFDIKKQKQDEQFRFTSPTSVASIRGTKGKMSGGEGHDTLVVTEGLISFSNTVSNRSVEVPAGSIAFSHADGTISVRAATADELLDAENAALGGALNDFRLELRNGQGESKELRLRFRQ